MFLKWQLCRVNKSRDLKCNIETTVNNIVLLPTGNFLREFILVILTTHAYKISMWNDVDVKLLNSSNHFIMYMHIYLTGYCYYYIILFHIYFRMVYVTQCISFIVS